MLAPHILNLPTHRLLTYYKKHYRGTNPYWDRWYDDYSDKAKYDEFEKDRNIIKAELDNREHVEQ